MTLPRLLPLVAVVLLAAAACSDGTGPSAPVADRVALVAALPDSVGVGDTVRLAARAYLGAATVPNVRISWRLLDPAAPTIVTVDSLGLLTAHVVGDVSLVVTAHARQPVEDTIRVRVRQLPRVVVIGAPTDSLLVSDSLQLTGRVADGWGETLGARIVWSSSDSTIAVPDSTGKVRAYNTGSAWIRATAGTAVDSVRVRADFRRALVGFDAFRTISANPFNSSTCGLDAAGAAYCFGGTEHARGAGPFPGAPVAGGVHRVSGGITFREVRSGQDNVCGLAVDGTQYCWGSNGDGQLGLGTRTPPRSDVPIASAQGLRFRDIDAGEHKAGCAISMADSVVYCWGHNDAGQVGRLPASVRDTVVAPVTGSLKATQVEVGPFHGCAIGVDRATWCWGQRSAFAGPVAGHLPPTLVAPAGEYVQVAVGNGFTCGLRPDGTAACFGGVAADSAGQSSTRTVAGTARFTRVIAGFSEMACGLTAGGALWCWDTWNASTPAGVPFVARHLMPGRVFLDASVSFAGSYAVTTTGDVYKW